MHVMLIKIFLVYQQILVYKKYKENKNWLNSWKMMGNQTRHQFLI
jgi:hypothetical protein